MIEMTDPNIQALHNGCEMAAHVWRHAVFTDASALWAGMS